MADHGIQITRTTISPPPVAVIGQGVIGVVGTAPDAAVDGLFGDGTAIEYNEPFKLNSRADAPSADLGAGGTLPDALNGIYQAGERSCPDDNCRGGFDRRDATHQPFGYGG